MMDYQYSSRYILCILTKPIAMNEEARFSSVDPIHSLAVTAKAMFPSFYSTKNFPGSEKNTSPKCFKTCQYLFHIKKCVDL